MKIIITAVAPNLESDVDPRFGRSAYLLVIDSETLEFQAHPNPGVHASGGAGIQAAQFAVDQQAQAVISGDFGPNAYGALSAAGVQMYMFGTCRTVRDAIARWQAGQLERVGAPTGPGHHRAGR